MAKSKRNNPFSTQPPQLPIQASIPPEGAGWIYEAKLDGYRIIAFCEDGNVFLATRNGLDYAYKFPDVAKSLSKLSKGRSMVFDGELVATDSQGISDFGLLQSHLGNTRGVGAPIYCVFDLIALDGIDMRNELLSKRKERLGALLENSPPNLHCMGYVFGGGKACFDAAAANGFEGIVAKRLDSVYSGARSPDWVKIKCANVQEFVIGGFVRPHSSASSFSSIIVGYYSQNETASRDNLIYAGRVGTGFPKALRVFLENKFSTNTSEECCFAPNKNLKAKKGEVIIWLRPVLVAQIQYREMTKEGLLRQASFKGLRFDKDAEEITIENTNIPILAGGAVDSEKAAKTTKAASNLDSQKQAPISKTSIVIAGVEITNPNKAMFITPKTTKGEVAMYYEKAGERMLPFLEGRITSVVRRPSGPQGDTFYKKHPGKNLLNANIVEVSSSSGDKKTYFYLDSVKGIITEAQMGTIEFHIWASKVESINEPDLMVFDFDPGEGVTLKDLRRGALDLKEILDQLYLKSYVKTSGSKGYHVLVPFWPSGLWDEFSSFSKAVGECLRQEWPEKYTLNIRKKERQGKIFIDYLRNSFGATCVAPYSLRAKDSPTVSMPISWEEIHVITPDNITLKRALKLVESPDPWEGFWDNRGSFL
ncbi:MAG: DNA ligase D [Eubacteriaceae bacterium]|nr:DNA ligase D [Eubacteriaceae bacterium]